MTGPRGPEPTYTDWTALLRVSDGGTAKVGHYWLDADRQVPGDVAGENLLIGWLTEATDHS